MLSDFFNAVLEATVRHAEVNKDKVLSPCKKTEVVDAKSLVVYILSKEGYYPSQIAIYLNMTKAGVRNLLVNVENRINNNKILKKILSDIQNEIASK